MDKHPNLTPSENKLQYDFQNKGTANTHENNDLRAFFEKDTLYSKHSQTVAKIGLPTFERAIENGTLVKVNSNNEYQLSSTSPKANKLPELPKNQIGTNNKFIDFDLVSTELLANHSLQIITDLLGFEPQKNKRFRLLDTDSKEGNEYLHQHSSGFYGVKNFANDEFVSPIQAYQKVKQIDYPTAIRELADTHLNLQAPPKNSMMPVTPVPNKPKAETKPFTIYPRKKFTPVETAYWQKFGLTGAIIHNYGVLALEKYETVNSEGKPYPVYASDENPIFAYEIVKGKTYKIYKPLDKTNRFFWLGASPNLETFFFGANGLPAFCDTILICEGFKDCLSVIANKHRFAGEVYAVGYDNNKANFDLQALQALQSRCKNLVLCYDCDAPSIKTANEIRNKYGLATIDLAHAIENDLGLTIGKDLKDISDLFALVQTSPTLFATDFFDTLVQKAIENKPEPVHPEPVAPEEKVSDEMLIFQKLQQTNDLLTAYASSEVMFAPAIINLNNEIPIFRKGTINLIQGKAGVHKSRLAELFCSLLLKSSDCETDFLGFSRYELAQYTVLLIDTERNLKEELPNAIQNIRTKAGYKKDENPPRFHYNSLKPFERKQRLNVLKHEIERVKKVSTNHLVILLDVVTDCISSFNNEAENLALFDYLGNLCDNYEVTFLLILHENPSSEKARGHTGSEGQNKASSQIQISFEKDAKGSDTDLIKIKFLKLRGAKKPEPIYLQYCTETKGLVRAEGDLINQVFGERKEKANIDSMVTSLENSLGSFQRISSGELVKQLADEMQASKRTIQDRLTEIIDNKAEISNDNGVMCTLHKEQIGKEVLYFLQLIQTDLSF